MEIIKKILTVIFALAVISTLAMLITALACGQVGDAIHNGVRLVFMGFIIAGAYAFKTKY